MVFDSWRSRYSSVHEYAGSDRGNRKHVPRPSRRQGLAGRPCQPHFAQRMDQADARGPDLELGVRVQGISSYEFSPMPPSQRRTFAMHTTCLIIAAVNCWL